MSTRMYTYMYPYSSEDLIVITTHLRTRNINFDILNGSLIKVYLLESTVYFDNLLIELKDKSGFEILRGDYE